MIIGWKLSECIQFKYTSDLFLFYYVYSIVIYNSADVYTCLSGLASFDYEDGGFEAADLLRIDFLFNKKLVEEFSFIGHRIGIQEKCRYMIDKLSENLPRQQFEIKIQAIITDTSTVIAKLVIILFHDANFVFLRTKDAVF